MPIISVCICTYQRPVLLRRLLESLPGLQTNGLFGYEIVVTDNDQAGSGKQVVEEFAKGSSLNVTYSVEPRQSISFARNRCVERAKGDFIAFIDDDEFPAKDWLLRLFETCSRQKVAGVLGPVRPHFDSEPPAWLIRGRFCERLEHETGFVMSWPETRTGNVLFDKGIVKGIDPIFRPEFAAASGDQDFFRRMMEKGHRFIWCNEAVAYEVVPPFRWTRQYLIERALLRGGHSLKVPPPRERVVIVLKSMVALPAYALALPFLLFGGHHRFMKYLVKLCHHAGRLSGVLGMNPVRRRGRLW
jgi:glycosyltransferase involved in cell wall biosynthesis